MINRAVVQGEGTAMRMKAGALRKECQRGGPLQSLLHRYTPALLTPISQSAACNQSHRVEARLARWLLMTRDRLGADGFRLTQEFLSNMLGLRREAVSQAAGALREQETLGYGRGRIAILNRTGLEAVSCRCYSVIRDEYDSFLTKN